MSALHKLAAAADTNSTTVKSKETIELSRVCCTKKSLLLVPIPVLPPALPLYQSFVDYPYSVHVPVHAER
jgi:hypothetical protein